MKDITLVTVNWNQRHCVELLLKSYVRHHYTGEPLKLCLVDNGSEDDSREWLNDNGVPFILSTENVGHENALNAVYNLIKTKWALLNDTDVEYHGNVYGYINEVEKIPACISAGELIDKNEMNGIHIQDRISPWFWLWRHDIMLEHGSKYFRNPANENWTYDVGSEHWETMKSYGFSNLNIERLQGDQDRDLISMKYPLYNHWGKVSWDIENKHGDRYSEVMRRRQAIKERIELYKDIDLRGKFVV